MPFIIHEPLEESKRGCNYEAHNPPSYIVLEPGRHVWECEICKVRTIITVPFRPIMDIVKKWIDEKKLESNLVPCLDDNKPETMVNCRCPKHKI